MVDFVENSIVIKQSTGINVHASIAALNFADGIIPTVDVVADCVMSISLPRTLQIYCMFNLLKPSGFFLYHKF